MRFHERAAINGQPPLFLPESRWVAPELPSLAGRGIKRIAIDVETKDPDLVALGPGVRRGAKIVGLAIGVEDRRWYLPVGHQGGGNLDARVVFEWAREELNALRAEVVGTNLAYDLDFLAEEGVTFDAATAFHDVQVAEPLLDEWRDEYNLDALSRDYLGEGKDETLLNEAFAAFGFSRKTAKSNLWRLPANLAGPYAEGDVDRPLRIIEKQLPRIEAEGLTPVYEIERKLIPILVAMRRKGVPISVPKIERARAYFVAERAKWAAEVKRLAGSKAELTEAESLAPALEARGIVVPLTKKTGVPSVTRILLERYWQRDDLARAILNGRKFNTLIGTFLDSQIMGHQTNGRVHPTFKQGRDDDGGSLARFAGSHPNMQFIPARESDWQDDLSIAPLVRGIFESEPGEQWQRDDYSQIEYRLLVHFAVGRGAEEARARYNADPRTDYHKFVGEMLGVAPDDKIRRKRVKNTNFAKGYGAQAPKLADTFGCTVAEAEEFIAEYDEKLPFAKDTFDAAARWAKKQGFVSTILKRKMRFPFWGPTNYQRKIPGKVFRSRDEAVAFYTHEHETANGKRYRNLYRCREVNAVERVNSYMALNRKLQGSNADIMKKGMVDAWEAGVCRVIGPYKVTVHDELGSSIPRTKAGDEAGRELTRIMERAVTLKVPVLVESGRGDDWGACN